MRTVRKSRLTKKSRNARIIGWSLRTGQPFAITDKAGRRLAIFRPLPKGSADESTR